MRAQRRMAGWSNTKKVLAARGARDRCTVARDVRAGLFHDLKPLRTSQGFASVNGVPNLWPPGALQRARWIRAGIAAGLTRQQLREQLELGATR